MRRLLLFTALLLACTPPAPASPTPSNSDSGQKGNRVPGGTLQPTPLPRPLATGPITELVADGLQLPANLTFAPDGRLFLTEVSLGRVRLIDHGVLQPPVVQVDQAVRPELGLLGLTLAQPRGSLP